MFTKSTSISFFILFSVLSSALYGKSPAPEILLPASVDNHRRPFFPEVISQIGESCGNASGIGYVFTYEINASRNLPANTDSTNYPYFTTFNHLNNGSEQQGTNSMFLDAWKFAHDNGIMNLRDFGSMEPRSTKWVSGYQHYLNGMSNRVYSIDSARLGNPEGLTFFKQLLFDKGTGSSYGSIFIITASVLGIQDATMPDGAEKDKYIITALGTDATAGLHTLTVTGYNDAISFDFNNDGSITTATDINNDGKVDMADSERGAFRCVNTWGDASWDSGFVYLPYRLLFVPQSKGGTYSDKGYHITISKDYSPLRTLKLTLSHKSRNALSVKAGIASDSSRALPECSRMIEQLNFRGGTLPMCGKGASASIELGLDISDLSDSIREGMHTACFLIIESKDSSGKCTALSLFDYTVTPPLEIHAPGLPRTLKQGLNYFKIVTPALSATPHVKPPFEHTVFPIRYIRNHLLQFDEPGIVRFQLFTGKGECIMDQSVHYRNNQYAIKQSLPKGIFFIRLFKSNQTDLITRSILIR